MHSVKSTIILIATIFALIGTGMLIGTFFLIKNANHFINTAIHTDGVVLENIEDVEQDDRGTHYSYRPKIQFQTKGNEEVIFVSSTGYGAPEYSNGDVVEVLYDPSNPHNAEVEGFFEVWGGGLIFGILGLVFSSFGYGLFAHRIWKKNKNARLMHNGQRITTKIDSVGLDESYTVNGRHPHMIYADWLDPINATIHHFKSDPIWFNPTTYIKSDMEVSIWIDPKNPRSYVMDTSFLPREAD